MDYKRIGAEIRRLRKMRGLKQKELGAAILRSESSIAKYEQGLVEIPPKALIAIADALGVDYADLLGISVQPTATPFSASFKWLESVGYKVRDFEEDGERLLTLHDVQTGKWITISDDDLHTLVDRLRHYTLFLISELQRSAASQETLGNPAE